MRMPPREPEAASVVVDLELPVAVRCADAHQHRLRAAVFADVDERFLDDAGDLAADARRQIRVLDLGREMRHDAGLLLEAPDQIRQVLEDLRRL